MEWRIVFKFYEHQGIRILNRVNFIKQVLDKKVYFVDVFTKEQCNCILFSLCVDDM